MRTRLKRIVRATWSTPAYGRALHVLDSLAFALGWATGGGRTGHTVFLAPSGRGNIGDQAMFDSFFHNVEGRVHVVVGAADAYRVTGAEAERMVVHALPRLIRGLPPVRALDVVRFGRLVRGAARLYVPGADTIDGGHPHASLARLGLVRLCANRGVDAIVQGFSWAPEVPESVERSARAAGRLARLLPRDPLSFERLSRAGVQATAASDLVFSYDRTAPLPDDLEALVADLEKQGIPFALLNMSGLIARKVDLADDYDTLVHHLHDRGLAVVALPHVIRSGDDDLVQMRALVGRSGGPQDVLVDRLLTPAQVKGLAARAQLTVTGRMHLAIMSLSHSTPAVTMATAGKVEGLYEFFDLPQLVVRPVRGCSAEAIRAVDAVLADRVGIARRIVERLPRVIALSRRNFTSGPGLDLVDEPVRKHA